MYNTYGGQMKESLKRLDQYLDRYNVESNEKWANWYVSMPDIAIPHNCFIKPLPPMFGVMTRFEVKNSHNKKITISLDIYDRVLQMGSPYWLIEHEGERTIVRFEDYKSVSHIIFEVLS